MAELSPSRAEIVPFRHPRLLAPQTVHALQADGNSDSGVVSQLTGYSEAVYAGSLEWPIGAGPVEVLWQRVSRNMLSLDQALTEAEAIGRRGDLIAPYALALARWTVQTATPQQIESSLQIARVTLAAAEVATPGADIAFNGWTAWRWAADAFIEVGRTGLMRAPDAAVYTAARSLLNRIIAWGKEKSEHEYGKALSLLGRFLLDPYKAAADPNNVEFDLWQARRRAIDDDAQDSPMPEPLDALRESADALRDAVGMLDVSEAASTWKALVQAVHSLSLIDLDAVAHGAGDEDVVAVAMMALEHLDASDDGYLMSFVQLVLAEHQGRLAQSGSGHTEGARDQQRPALGEEGEPLAELAARVSKGQAISVGMWRFEQALGDDLSLAESILAETWALAADYASDEVRRGVLEAQLRLMVRRISQVLRDLSGSVTDRATQLEAALTGEDATAIAAALLGLAATSGGTDEELLGLELVNHALELDPSIPERMPTLLTYLIALLRFGQASNLGTAEQLPEAIEWYAFAAGTFIDCGLRDMANTCLLRIGANAATDASTAVAAVLGLRRSGLKLMRSLEGEGIVSIAELLRTSSAALISAPIPRGLPMLRDELAKGLLLGSAIASPMPVALDEHGRQLLNEIEVLDRQASGEGRTAGVAGSAIEDELMLASFVAPSEATPGRNSAEAAVNLKRTFDEHFATELYGRAGSAEWATVEQLQSWLDERTVLVSMFLGAVPDGRLGVYVQALTTGIHDAAVIPREVHSGLVELEHSGVKLTQSPLGLFVADLRSQVQEDPIFDDVDRDAADSLRSLPGFFGPFAERLANWHAAGLDQSCDLAAGAPPLPPMASVHLSRD